MSKGIDWSSKDPHTEKKHEILGKYIRGWASVTTSKFPVVYIFDLLAGRGEYEDGKPGSPRVILEEISSLMEKRPTKTVECYFTESDENTYHKLREVVGKVKCPPNVVKTVRLGEFQNEVFKLINKVKYPKNPFFFFIDPEGIEPLDFNVIRQLASLRRSEVLITFMVSGVLRNKENIELVKKIYGTMIDSNTLAAELIDIYKEQLHKEAKILHLLDYPVDFDTAQRPIYSLVFGTNNDRGLIIMKDVFRKAGFKHFSRKETEKRRQTNLFNSFEKNEIVVRVSEFLMSNYSGKTVKYDDARKAVYAVKGEQFTEEDLRKALAHLINLGKAVKSPADHPGFRREDEFIFS